MLEDLETEDGNLHSEPIRALMCHVTGFADVPTGMEALAYAKSNKLFPTYVLMQNIWNKLRQLQEVEGFTGQSPIWNNGYYEELQSLDCGVQWERHKVARMRHIFAVRKLIPFQVLREQFHLPNSMYFYYMQLHHAVTAQTGGALWILSPAPIFRYMVEVSQFKGLISST